MLRIVALADTHMYHWELGELPEGDVLIHAGDLLHQGGLDELEGAAEWLLSQPHRHKVLVPGNHDQCLARHWAASCALLQIPGLTILRHEALEIEGLKIWGSPTTPMPLSWAFALPRGSDELKARWAQIPTGLDLLITHGPPEGVGDSGSTGFHYGCRALKAAIDQTQPVAHLFGHIHQDGGLWRLGATTFINVTTWEAERAVTVFDYDVTAQELIPVQIPTNLRDRYA